MISTTIVFCYNIRKKKLHTLHCIFLACIVSTEMDSYAQNSVTINGFGFVRESQTLQQGVELVKLVLLLYLCVRIIICSAISNVSEARSVDPLTVTYPNINSMAFALVFVVVVVVVVVCEAFTILRLQR